jgi:hypothetical protein
MAKLALSEETVRPAWAGLDQRAAAAARRLAGGARRAGVPGPAVAERGRRRPRPPGAAGAACRAGAPALLRARRAIATQPGVDDAGWTRPSRRRRRPGAGDAATRPSRPRTRRTGCCSTTRGTATAAGRPSSAGAGAPRTGGASPRRGTSTPRRSPGRLRHAGRRRLGRRAAADDRRQPPPPGRHADVEPTRGTASSTPTAGCTASATCSWPAARCSRPAARSTRR